MEKITVSDLQNLQSDSNVIQYVMISAGDEYFGIDIKYIDNIVRYQHVTRIPKAQKYFKGVINLRGEIISVMNLRSKLGIPEIDITKNTRIIILKPEEDTSVGIIVDEIKEVINLHEGDIEKSNTSDNGEIKGSYLDGIGKYDNMLISLLNIQNLIIEKDVMN